MADNNLPPLVAKIQIDTTQLDVAAKKVDTALKGVENSAKGSTEKVETLTSKVEEAGKKAQEAGKGAFEHVDEGLKKVNESLKATQEKVAKFGEQVAKAGQTGSAGGLLGAFLGPLANIPLLGVAAAGIGGLVTELEHATNELAQNSAETLRNADLLRMDTGQFQALSMAAQHLGMDQTTLTATMVRFQKNVVDGAPALKAAGFSLKDLGITSQDVGTQINQLADWMSKATDAEQKNAVASALLGKGGLALNDIFSKGSAFLIGYQHELESYGVILSTTDLKTGALAAATHDQMGLALEGLKNQVLVPLEGAFSQLWMMIGKGAKDSQGSFHGIGDAIASLVGVIASFISGLTGVEITQKDLNGLMNSYSAQLNAVTPAVADEQKAMDGTAASIKEMTKQLQYATKATHEQVTGIDQQIKSLNDFKTNFDQSSQDQITQLNLIKQAYDDQIKTQDLQQQLADDNHTSTLAQLKDQLKAVQDTYIGQRKVGESEVDYQLRLKEQDLAKSILTEEQKRAVTKDTQNILQTQLQQETQWKIDAINAQKTKLAEQTTFEIQQLDTRKTALTNSLQEQQDAVTSATASMDQQFQNLTGHAVTAASTSSASISGGLDASALKFSATASKFGDAIRSIFQHPELFLSDAEDLGGKIGNALGNALTGSLGVAIMKSGAGRMFLNAIGKASDIENSIGQSFVDRANAAASLPDPKTAMDALSNVTKEFEAARESTGMHDETYFPIQQHIDDLYAQLEARVSGSMVGKTPAQVSRAGGGNVFGPAALSVGERGREMLYMPAGSSGTVVPNDQIGGGHTINVQAQTNADPHMIAAEIVWAIKVA